MNLLSFIMYGASLKSKAKAHTLFSDPYFRPRKLETLLSSIRTTKQKQLLSSHFFDLRQTYIIERNNAFNKKYNSIEGLGKSYKSMVIIFF